MKVAASRGCAGDGLMFVYLSSIHPTQLQQKLASQLGGARHNIDQ